MAVERDEDGFSVTALITEPVDQAALLRMIDHLNSLGLPLVLVEHLPTEGTELKVSVETNQTESNAKRSKEQ